jgi:hypothetical protein
MRGRRRSFLDGYRDVITELERCLRSSRQTLWDEEVHTDLFRNWIDADREAVQPRNVGGIDKTEDLVAPTGISSLYSVGGTGTAAVLAGDTDAGDAEDGEQPEAEGGGLERPRTSGVRAFGGHEWLQSLQELARTGMIGPEVDG